MSECQGQQIFFWNTFHHGISSDVTRKAYGHTDRRMYMGNIRLVRHCRHHFQCRGINMQLFTILTKFKTLLVLWMIRFGWNDVYIVNDRYIHEWKYVHKHKKSWNYRFSTIHGENNYSKYMYWNSVFILSPMHCILGMTYKRLAGH